MLAQRPAPTFFAGSMPAQAPGPTLGENGENGREHQLGLLDFLLFEKKKKGEAVLELTSLAPFAFFAASTFKPAAWSWFNVIGFLNCYAVQKFNNCVIELGSKV